MKWHATSGSITLPALGFIEPCIPSLAKKPPRGADWIFELKNDGYRLLVRKAGVDIRIYSRRGADFTSRFPSLVAAARRLLSRDPDVRLTLTDGIQVAKTPANI